MRRKDPSLEAKWREHFTKFRQSKLTVVEYCRQAGISQSAFFRRRQELDATWQRQKATPETARNRAVVSHCKSPFVPVAVAPVVTAEIELPGGIRIRVPATDHQAITTILRAATSVGEERS